MFGNKCRHCKEGHAIYLARLDMPVHKIIVAAEMTTLRDVCVNYEIISTGRFHEVSSDIMIIMSSACSILSVLPNCRLVIYLPHIYHF